MRPSGAFARRMPAFLPAFSRAFVESGRGGTMTSPAGTPPLLGAACARMSGDVVQQEPSLTSLDAWTMLVRVPDE